MSRKAFVVVALLTSLIAAAPAFGQEDTATLGERLNRFRRNLFGGEPEEQPRPTPRAASPRGQAPAHGTLRAKPNPGNDYFRPSAGQPNPRAAESSRRSPVGSSRRTAQPGYARSRQSENGEDQEPTVATDGEFSPSSGVPPAMADTDEEAATEPIARQAAREPAPESNNSLAERLARARRGAAGKPGAAVPAPPVAQRALSGNATPAPGSPAPSANNAPTGSDPGFSGPLPRRPAGSESRPGTSQRTAQLPAAPGAAARPEGRGASAQETLLSGASALLTVETFGPRKIKMGTTANYSVKVQNPGKIAARDVIVTVKVPEGADLVGTQPSTGATRPATGGDGGTALEWRIEQLDPNGRAELALRVIPRKARSFDLAVAWTQAPLSSQAMIEVQEPKLLLNLSGPGEVFFGERELYKLTLSNPGTGDAEDVMVRLLPTTPGEDQAVSHQIGLLRAGESKAVELELTARQMGTLRLKAEASATGGLQAAVDQEVLVRRADLKVDVEAPSLLYAGTVGTYKIHVANAGNAVAKNVSLATMLPPGATYVSSTEGGMHNADQGRITWTMGSLRAGGDWSVSYKCQLTAAGPTATQIVATADSDLRTSATANTEVEALADLTLEVKDPQGPVPVGTEAMFEVIVRNRGTKSAVGVEVVAFFSPGIDPVDVDGGPHEIGPGQIALAPIASLAAGQEVVFKIKAKAHRPGNHIFRAEVECAELGTKLSSEETTHFYGEDAVGTQPEEPSTVEEASEPPITPHEPETLVPTPTP